MEPNDNRISRRRVVQLLATVPLASAAYALGAHGPDGFSPNLVSALVPAGDFGVVGDGTTDDTVAMQRAMSDTASRGVTLSLPAGTYKISSTLRAPRGLRLQATDATLSTYISSLGSSGAISATLLIDGVSDVTVSGLSIDGRKSAFSGATQYKAGICVNNASNIVIDGCTLYNCKGDGLIFYSRTPGHRNRNITVRQTTMRGNHRLGCAVNDLTDATFTQCTFTKTNGVTPMGGLDIEPDRDSAWIDNISFHECVFSGNGSTAKRDGAGATVSLHENPINPQGNIHFYDCTMRDNATMGSLLFYAHDVSFNDCVMERNGNAGLALQRTASSITVKGGRIAGNYLQGIVAPTRVGEAISKLTISNVTFTGNGTAWPRNYDAITLRRGCSNVVIRDCEISGDHGYGIWADAAVAGSLRVIDTTITGAAKGDVYPESVRIESSEPDPTEPPVGTGRLSLSKTESRYNGIVIANLSGLAPGETVSLRWNQGDVIATATANESGAAVASFRTPLAPYGRHTVSVSSTNGGAFSARLKVTPRIKITESSGEPGSSLRVYLYGFAAGERVELQWSKANSTEITVLATLRIADNGRASKEIRVPTSAGPGSYTLRGKVVGVQRSTSLSFSVAAARKASTATSTPSATATGTRIPTATETTADSPTIVDTDTPEPTATDTSSPTPVPTEIPTETPTTPVQVTVTQVASPESDPAEAEPTASEE